ncbi:MAG: hypothetical protein KGL93_08470 [Gemmatimonadota bacterium]|nr:hypothetical protein [Gemmatimonadota bacterium]HEU4990197.1 VOC family protein [Gemmatimonadaceae bacterium]
MSAPAASLELKQLTPVMVVDEVEPCLSFWWERLGFTVENQVPGPDGKLVFASARRGPVEVMYQTRESVVADAPALAGELAGHSITLFLTVNDLDAIERALVGVPVVKPRHETFYGSTELYVREPGGNVVGFAAFK